MNWKEIILYDASIEELNPLAGLNSELKTFITIGRLKVENFKVCRFLFEKITIKGQTNAHMKALLNCMDGDNYKDCFNESMGKASGFSI